MSHPPPDQLVAEGIALEEGRKRHDERVTIAGS